MNKPSEPTVTLAFHQNEIEAIRASWTQDVRKLMKLESTNKELIKALQDMIDAYDSGVEINGEMCFPSWVEKAMQVLEKAKNT